MEGEVGYGSLAPLIASLRGESDAGDGVSVV